MTQKRAFSGLFVLVSLLGCVGISVYLLPNAIAKISYAMETGRAAAARDGLSGTDNLSENFYQVATAMRPSVVSIQSVRKATSQPNQFRGRAPQLPREFEEFFGNNNPFEDFFQVPANPDGEIMAGSGTGVIVSNDGYVVTNNHVVDGANDITVRLSDKRELKAKVIGTDKATDLALLKVEATDLVSAPWGDSAQMKVGQWVLAIGSPFGLDNTVTAGIVSAVGRSELGIAKYEDFIQTDASINPGNSGGPLVNLKGEVIGINTAILSRTGRSSGIGFSIPSNLASNIIESLKRDGKIERGYLGVQIQELTPELAESFNFAGKEGVLVGDVVTGGPADKAGLKNGDIITEMNGSKITSVRQLQSLAAALPIGSVAKIGLYREDKFVETELTIERLDESKLAQSGGRSGASKTDDKLGVAVGELTSEKASELGLSEKVRGVVVEQVDINGPAATIGLQTGDVISAIGNTPVTSVADFEKAMAEQDLAKGVRLRIIRDNVSSYMMIRIAR